MSLVKSELTMATLTEVGVRLEDQLEAAKVELGETRGVQSGLTLSAQRLAQTSLALDSEPMGRRTRLEYRHAKKYLAAAEDQIRGLSRKAAEQVLRVQGKVASLEQSVKLLVNMRDAERGRVAALQTGTLVPEDSGLLPTQAPRAPGAHPGNPLAALRRRGNTPGKAPSSPLESLKATEAAMAAICAPQRPRKAKKGGM